MSNLTAVPYSNQNTVIARKESKSQGEASYYRGPDEFLPLTSLTSLTISLTSF